MPELAHNLVRDMLVEPLLLIVLFIVVAVVIVFPMPRLWLKATAMAVFACLLHLYERARDRR